MAPDSLSALLEDNAHRLLRNDLPTPLYHQMFSLLRDRILSLLVPDTTGPMRYALDMRTFWFSHYLSTGLRTSSGILLIALAALALLPPGWAMAAGC